MLAPRVGRYPPAHPRLPRSPRTLALRAVALVVLIPLWVHFLAPRSLGGPVSVIWVSGISMQPTLRTGDLSLLYRRERYDVGDIVAFDIPEGGTVIHRVISADAEGYRFQGDNRASADPWVLDRTAIHGRQLVAVPKAASVLAVLRRPIVMAGLVALLTLIIGLGRR